MGARRFPLSIPAPMRGMNVRDIKFPNLRQVRKLVNMRLGKFGNIVRRPGYHEFQSGFAAQTFFGFHSYNDSQNVERLLTVNNNAITEFDNNNINVRLSGLTDGKYGHFVTAKGACFFVNGFENKKGVDTDWTDLGVVAPQAAPTLAAATSGGSLADGDYIIKYSYVVKSGASRLIITSSDFSATATVSGGGGSGKITVSNIFASGNPRVTHIIVWATVADGSALFEATEITNGTTAFDYTTAVDAASDLAFSTVAGNDGPPGNFVWLDYSDGRLWGIPKNDPTNIYPSNRGTNFDLEYFNTDNLVAMSKSGLPLTFTFGLNGDQFAMTKSETTVLRNSDVKLPFPVSISENIGTESPYSWVPWKNGMIGRTNRGIEFFDGFTFSLMGDDIYPALDEDQNKAFGQGFIFDDPEFGQLYQLAVKLPSDIPGGLDDVPGFLPGSGTGGSGVGLPSDDFDDNSKSSSRWNSTTGTATIAETGGELKITDTGTTVEDVYEESTATLNQNIDISVGAVINSIAGLLMDRTIYLRLFFDSSNYAEIGFRNATSATTVRSRIAVGGVVTTDDGPAAPTDTVFRIRISHDRVETLYKTTLGAWEILGTVFDTGYSPTGWKIRLGMRTDDGGVVPNIDIRFDNLRAQFDSGTGLEDITPDVTETNNTNALLTCTLRTWQPGIFDRETNTDLQPPWSLETIRAQRLVETQNGDILYLDNTTGKCYIASKLDIFDDQEFIPILITGKIFDEYVSRGSIIKAPRTNKWATWADVTGNWGLPWKLILTSYPRVEIDERSIFGFNDGTPMDSAQMQNNALANTDSVSFKQVFRKMLGTAFSFTIKKMDQDPAFAIETIESETNVARSRI